MQKINFILFKSNSIYLIFLAASFATVMALSILFSIEEIQTIFIPLFVVGIYFLNKKKQLEIPSYVFLATLMIWLGLICRVQAMNYFDYFKGRLIIGRFSSDDRGLEARELLRKLKIISITYNLPGPSLLPLSNTKNDLRSFLDFKKEPKMSSPALLLFGVSNGYELHLPKVVFDKVFECSKMEIEEVLNDCEQLPKTTLMLKKTRDFKWAINPYPAKLLIRKEPKNVINHYIAWLSAYFSSEINIDKTTRIDILTELLNLKGLPIEGRELTFAKLVFSYEQLLSEDIEFNTFDQRQIRRRLLEVSQISKNFLGPELYGISINMLALLYAVENDEPDSILKSKELLKGLIKNRSISNEQKAIAAYNLGNLELSLN